MTWSVIVDTKAHKQLRKIPRAQNERILVALETLASNPYSGDIEKIAGEKDVCAVGSAITEYSTRSIRVNGPLMFLV